MSTSPKPTSQWRWQSAEREIIDEQFDLLCADLAMLNNWERNFVLSVDRVRHHMSDKQRAVVCTASLKTSGVGHE